MNIPGLGYLFRSTSDKNDRTELIVLLRPTVLKTPEIAAANAKEITDRLPGVRKVKEEMQAEERKMRQLNSQKPLDN
jgi:type II secretory pathway component GspD/PulD (secretin)